MRGVDDFRRTLTAARDGDRAAFETLFSRNMGALRAFVRARVGGLVGARESVDDLVQSVCREALRDMDAFEYRGEQAFRRWLYLHATRKILHRHAHLTRDKRDVRREVQNLDELLGHYGTVCTPSRHAAAREEVERIERLLDALPEDQRDAVTMSRMLEMPTADIAAALGRSESAVRGLVARGLAQLSRGL